MTARRMLGAAAVAVALLALLFLAVDPAVAQQARTRFQSWVVMPKLTVEDAADISGAVTLNSTLDVDGAATFNSTLDVDGAATFNSTLDVDGNLSSGTGDLTVADDLYVTGALGAAGAITTASTLDVTGAATLRGATTINNNLSVTGTFNSAGNASTGGTFVSTGNTTVGGNLIVDDLLRFDVAGAQTLTQDEPITPTVSLWRITAAGEVSTASIVAGTLGDVLMIWNSGSNQIIISDTGTLKLSGDATLGQYDSLMLFSDGTNWIELAQADN